LTKSEEYGIAIQLEVIQGGTLELVRQLPIRQDEYQYTEPRRIKYRAADKYEERYGIKRLEKARKSMSEWVGDSLLQRINFRGGLWFSRQGRGVIQAERHRDDVYKKLFIALEAIESTKPTTFEEEEIAKKAIEENPLVEAYEKAEYSVIESYEVYARSRYRRRQLSVKLSLIPLTALLMSFLKPPTARSLGESAMTTFPAQVISEHEHHDELKERNECLASEMARFFPSATTFTDTHIRPFSEMPRTYQDTVRSLGTIVYREQSNGVAEKISGSSNVSRIMIATEADEKKLLTIILNTGEKIVVKTPGGDYNAYGNITSAGSMLTVCGGNYSLEGGSLRLGFSPNYPRNHYITFSGEAPVMPSVTPVELLRQPQGAERDATEANNELSRPRKVLMLVFDPQLSNGQLLSTFKGWNAMCVTSNAT